MVGDIILALFPFTNLQGSKNRPVVVVANVSYPGEPDWMVCEITTQPHTHGNQITLSSTDLATGHLLRQSWVRPDRSMTLNESLFGRTVAQLTGTKLAELLAAVRTLF
jgi:mRNA interferase MazF